MSPQRNNIVISVVYVPSKKYLSYEELIVSFQSKVKNMFQIN